MLLHQGGAGVPQDRAAARLLFERGCTLRSGDGCRNSGVYYRDAIGVPRDAERARSFFQQACELGIERACREAQD